MSQRWYRYTFPAVVWTVARNREEAVRNLAELTGTAQHTSVGISIDHKPLDREYEPDWDRS